MAQLKWALTCERAIIDRQTNAASYIDAVEELLIPQLPFPIPPFVVGTLWERGEVGEVIDVRVRFLDPSGRVLTEIPTRLDDPVAIRHRANFGVFAATRDAGRHEVLVEQLVATRWKEVARIPISVAVQPTLELATVSLKEAVSTLTPDKPPRPRRR